MALTLPFTLGRGAGRLATLRSLFNNACERAAGILRITGAVADAQTVTIGTDVLELDTLTTAIGGGATLTVADDTATVVTLSAVTGVAVGDVLKCESEILLVTSVGTAGNADTHVKRGRSGTTAAAHAAAACTKQAVTAGRIPIGIVGTTNANAADALVAEINAQDRGTDAGIGGIVAKKVTDGTTVNVLISAEVKGAVTKALAETLANGAWDAAAMYGGANPIRRGIAAYARAAVAADVTQGFMYFPVDEAPTIVFVKVRTSGGAVKAWDGDYAVVAAASGFPAYVVVDNAGAADWAATDVVQVLAIS